jgi:opacity protein-like surface antigen
MNHPNLLSSSVTIAFLLILSFSGNAQQSTAEKSKVESSRGLYGYGGIGPVIPLGNFGSERQIGLDLNTALEYRFDKGFLIRGMFDFSSFQFNKGTVSQVSNGTTYAISGANNLISLIGAIGYSRNIGRFSPYTFIGAGATIISKPFIDIDKINNTVQIDMKAGTYFSTAAGAGLDFILNPIKPEEKETKKTLVILYAEGFYTYLPSQTEVSTYKVNLLSFNIGLKSKF